MGIYYSLFKYLLGIPDDFLGRPSEALLCMYEYICPPAWPPPGKLFCIPHCVYVLPKKLLSHLNWQPAPPFQLPADFGLVHWSSAAARVSGISGGMS